MNQVVSFSHPSAAGYDSRSRAIHESSKPPKIYNNTSRIALLPTPVILSFMIFSIFCNALVSKGKKIYMEIGLNFLS